MIAFQRSGLPVDRRPYCMTYYIYVLPLAGYALFLPHIHLHSLCKGLGRSIGLTKREVQSLAILYEQNVEAEPEQNGGLATRD